jgi:hypothetical protein
MFNVRLGVRAWKAERGGPSRVFPLHKIVVHYPSALSIGDIVNAIYHQLLSLLRTLATAEQIYRYANSAIPAGA